MGRKIKLVTTREAIRLCDLPVNVDFQSVAVAYGLLPQALGDDNLPLYHKKDVDTLAKQLFRQLREAAREQKKREAKAYKEQLKAKGKSP